MNNIVFDSQNQKWMVPIPGTTAERILNKYTLSSNGMRCCKCAAITCVFTCYLFEFLNIAGKPSFSKWLAGGFATSCTVGAIAGNRFYKNKTTRQIQRYVEENGWGEFKATQPIEGQRCFIPDAVKLGPSGPRYKAQS